jgi:copper chaperone
MKLQVSDMVCGGCVDIITQAIISVDPGAEVLADLGTKTLDIETQASTIVVQEAIAQAGYKVIAL